MVPKDWKPWEGRWQVCFVPAPLHPFFRLLQKLRSRSDHLDPPWQHVFLIQPLDVAEHWLVAEWTLMQYGVCVVGRAEIARLHAFVSARGAMLEFTGADHRPIPRLLPAFMPMSCVSFVRSVMGLPPRHFLLTAKELWYELLDLGAVVLVDPPRGEGKPCRSSVAVAAATTMPSGR